MLYNNAGIMQPPIEMLTADGYDVQFGTNVLGTCVQPLDNVQFTENTSPLGHFYFTQLLMPLLLSTAKTTPSGKVRVINVSSMGHLGVDHVDYDTMKENPKRTKFGPWKLYFQSKFVRRIVVLRKHPSLHPCSRETFSTPPSYIGATAIRASSRSPYIPAT